MPSLLCSLLFCSAAFAQATFLENGNKIRLRGVGLKEQAKIFFVADTHFAFADPRDEEYRDNYKRMAQYQAPRKALDKLIDRAGKGGDLVIFGGDIISFPTQANIDFFLEETQKFQIPWLYTSGNHDWHFEGLPGSEAEIRDEWTHGVMAPLFQGENPLMAVREFKGMKVILIDNATHQILPEQLEFFKKEIADGKPAILALHIPLYVNGRGLDFGCGHPDWNAAHDPHDEIERRERWPESGHTQTTMDFCQAVWNAPNLLGILAGHTHSRSTDFHQGKFQLVAPRGADGDFLEITIQ